MVVSAAAAGQRATDTITKPTRQALPDPEPGARPPAGREIEAT
jgi:hypothetical protein